MRECVFWRRTEKDLGVQRTGPKLIFTDFCLLSDRDEDPDPVGSGDFWPAGSGSGTFYNRSGSGSYL